MYIRLMPHPSGSTESQLKFPAFLLPGDQSPLARGLSFLLHQSRRSTPRKRGTHAFVDFHPVAVGWAALTHPQVNVRFQSECTIVQTPSTSKCVKIVLRCELINHSTTPM